jgi:hypothetical protein
MDGAITNAFGDNPQGYLVYTPDGHVFVQMANPERRELFAAVTGRGLVLRETTEANTSFGFLCYSGTFKVCDGQLIHRMELHVAGPSANGRVEERKVEFLDGDQLVLVDPRNNRLEWQRLH